MNIEKLMDNMYGVELFPYDVRKLDELEDAAVVHMIVHHTYNREIILEVLQKLIGLGCKIFHIFGEYSELWTDALHTFDDNRIIYIDYGVSLENFIMDTGTHYVEETRMRPYPWYAMWENRVDYVLYDDYMFFEYLKEDLSCCKEV